jgi:hypothetical protein
VGDTASTQAFHPPARLAAVSLSTQNKIVGEAGGGVQAYGRAGVGDVLGDGGGRPLPPFYLGAQASSWAPILLPRPWAHFLDWFGDGRLALPGATGGGGANGSSSSSTPPSPCLPGLASNQWWARAARPGAIWTAWWHAFA